MINTNRKYGCVTLSQACNVYDFHDFFNYSSIVTASFIKIMVFYKDIIIENFKYILKGNKYIASMYSNF